jgi:5-methylcytosine-specific restriction endonuclease McrA
MDAELAKACADKLRDELGVSEMGSWSFEDLYCGMRDDLYCVYCGCDLIKDRDDLSGRDIFNYLHYFDHLLPTSKYPELERELSNRVLCCTPCNQLKQDWDPNQPMPIYLARTGQLLEEDRKELIRRSKEHLQGLRRTADENFAKQRSRIIDCMDRGGGGKGEAERRLGPSHSGTGGRTPAKLNVKKWFSISAGLGAGTALTVALLLGVISWHTSRPKPWNTDAIKAHFATLELTGGLDNLPVQFGYDLENTTDSNYMIGTGSSIVVMATLAQDHALSEEFGNSPGSKISVSAPSFIPPKGVARITVRVAYDYPSDFTPDDKADAQKVSKYLGRKVKEISGFVAFDQFNHYQIELPSGWQKFQTE